MDKDLTKEIDKNIKDMKSQLDKKIEEIEETVKDKFEEFDKDVSSVMGEVPDESKLDSIIENLKAQQKKEVADVSIIKGDKRLPGEDFAEYKARIKLEKKALNKYSNGRVVHESIFDGPKLGGFNTKN